MLLTTQALPDYLVRADAFDKGMHRIWTVGDRFRMYFGGRAGSKSGKHSTSSHALRAENWYFVSACLSITLGWRRGQAMVASIQACIPDLMPGMKALTLIDTSCDVRWWACRRGVLQRAGGSGVQPAAGRRGA